MASREQTAAAAAVRLRELEDAARYREDPWAFLTERVQWLDPLESDPERQVAPIDTTDAYPEYLVREWEAHWRRA